MAAAGSRMRFMEPFAPLDALRAFRGSLYRCFDRRADALFELGDAVLTAAQVVPSPVHLSLEPSHRRRWGSLYAAVDQGRIDEEALRRLLARHPLAGGGPPIYAGDVNVWACCGAESNPLCLFDGGCAFDSLYTGNEERVTKDNHLVRDLREDAVYLLVDLMRSEEFAYVGEGPPTLR